MVKTMADYLPFKVADYEYTLNIRPQVSMTHTGAKTQDIHEYDDGTLAIITLSEQSRFEIKVQWNLLTHSEASIILDLYHDYYKANGFANTFYFYHHIDEKIYVVRFMTPLTQVFRAGLVGYRENPTITLRVEGVKE